VPRLGAFPGLADYRVQVELRRAGLGGFFGVCLLFGVCLFFGVCLLFVGSARVRWC